MDENLFRSLYEHIAEAQDQALMNGIQANTIIINEGIAKTNGFFFNAGNRCIKSVPPTILGLKMQYREKLPMDANFMMYHSNFDIDEYNQSTTSKKDVVQEIIEYIQKWYEESAPDNSKLDCIIVKSILDNIIQDLKEIYDIEEEDENYVD